MEIRNGEFACFHTFSVNSDRIDLNLLRTVHEYCKPAYAGVFH